MTNTNKERNMQFFMKGKAKVTKEEDVIVTTRYLDEKGNPIPFVIKPIDTTLIDLLQDECTKPVYKKGKKVDEKLDAQRFAARLGIESTLYPDFKDPAILQSYNLVDPVDLAKEVLSIGGEYAEWLNAVQRINGYDEDFNELVEDAKPSLKAETVTQATPTMLSTT